MSKREEKKRKKQKESVMFFKGFVFIARRRRRRRDRRRRRKKNEKKKQNESVQSNTIMSLKTLLQRQRKLICQCNPLLIAEFLLEREQNISKLDM